MLLCRRLMAACLPLVFALDAAPRAALLRKLDPEALSALLELMSDRFDDAMAPHLSHDPAAARPPPCADCGAAVDRVTCATACVYAGNFSHAACGGCRERQVLEWRRAAQHLEQKLMERGWGSVGF
jgi:hypothetical protein